MEKASFREAEKLRAIVLRNDQSRQCSGLASNLLTIVVVR